MGRDAVVTRRRWERRALDQIRPHWRAALDNVFEEIHVPLLNELNEVTAYRMIYRET
jgi:hypothetical protein